MLLCDMMAHRFVCFERSVFLVSPLADSVLCVGDNEKSRYSEFSNSTVVVVDDGNFAVRKFSPLTIPIALEPWKNICSLLALSHACPPASHCDSFER